MLDIHPNETRGLQLQYKAVRKESQFTACVSLISYLWFRVFHLYLLPASAGAPNSYVDLDLVYISQLVPLQSALDT